MKDRIKQIRKAFGLTQDEFAEKLKIKRSSIANYEAARNGPTDAVITLINREFGVSEEWLRNGTGEMFAPQTEDEELAKLVGDFLQDETPEFKKKLVTLIIKMDDDEIEKLQGYADFLLNKKESE